MFKDEIAEHMKKTGLKSSDNAWLQKYQWAVNKVIESEGGEDAIMEKYGEMAKAWNEAKPPEELKRR